MVSTVAPALACALYSEDRADAGQDFAVLHELLLGMLQQLEPGLKTNHIKIEPAQPVRKERVCGSFWKERPSARPGAQESRRRLIKDVAAAIRLGRLVFFHVDADAVWAERARCEHAGVHWPRFVHDVLTVLRNAGAVIERAELDHVLILAMPFWEIESWAYANVARLREILAEPGDLAALARWQDDLGQLDEIADIKDCLSIRDARTLELVKRAHGFPADGLVAAGRSYAAVVTRLRDSSLVKRGLLAAATRRF